VGQTSVVRSAADAPPIGSDYTFVNCGRSFTGRVIGHSRLRKAQGQVYVRLELTEAESTRLILGDDNPTTRRLLDRSG
jgi:hypothetical protein